jgi:carboxyl-terminal processing protease
MLKKINGDILYLRVSSFMDMNISNELKKQINKHKKTTKAVVLDLRNNPGGQLSQAIEVSDLFIDKGVIVSQKGRNPAENEEFEASYLNSVTKVPMVVLVNEGSASASEIVSGALQDHNRAVVVGVTTFGKGSVQRIIPIVDSGEEAIKLTVAKYYLPSGRTIQAKGIIPDIEVFEGKVVTQEKSQFKIKEENMRKHLKSELTKIGEKITEENESADKNVITHKQLMEDNQLKVGVDILKSLIKMNK